MHAAPGLTNFHIGSDYKVKDAFLILLVIILLASGVCCCTYI